MDGSSADFGTGRIGQGASRCVRIGPIDQPLMIECAGAGFWHFLGMPSAPLGPVGGTRAGETPSYKIQLRISAKAKGARIMAQSIPVAVICPPVCHRSQLIGHVALFSSPEEPVTCLSTPKSCHELPDARTPTQISSFLALLVWSASVEAQAGTVVCTRRRDPNRPIPLGIKTLIITR